MTDEWEAGGTRPRIVNKEQFEQWLEKTQPPPAICLALAVRAVLRALPFIALDPFYTRAPRPKATYQAASRLFRAIATSWVAAKYPGNAHELRSYIDTANNAALAEATSSDSSLIRATAETSTITHLIYSVSQIDSGFALDISALDVDYFSVNEISSSDILYKTLRAVHDTLIGILSAVTNISDTTAAREAPDFLVADDKKNFVSKSRDKAKKSAEKAIWRAVEQDVRQLSSGMSARQLTDAALWHGTPDPLVLDSWRRFAIAMPDLDGWWVWKNWYEDRLNGKTHGEAHELICAIVPVEEWDKGPAAANAWIARRLEELKKTNKTDNDYVTSPPDDFSEMTEDEAVEAITNWFFENFEDPAHRTPYESAEGGYQYIWGGTLRCS